MTAKWYWRLWRLRKAFGWPICKLRGHRWVKLFPKSAQVHITAWWWGRYEECRVCAKKRTLEDWHRPMCFCGELGLFQGFFDSWFCSLKCQAEAVEDFEAWDKQLQ